MPDKAKEYLRKLWKNDSDILKVMVPCLGTVDIKYPTDIFFFDVIPVVPPIVRPVNFVDGQLIDHPQSQVYKYIIQDCLVLRNIIQTIQDGDTSQLPEEGRVRNTFLYSKIFWVWRRRNFGNDNLEDLVSKLIYVKGRI